MIDKVFNISGEKASTLIVDDYAIKISSSSSDRTVEAFKENFEKRLSLATKTEIKLKNIR